MESFKTFVEQRDFVEFILNEFDSQHFQEPAVKPWSAKKPEILHMWRNLRPDMPIYMMPVTQGSDTTYGEDGIRITGSHQFIAGVLGRIKDLLAYENPHMKLRLVFKGVSSDKGPVPNKQSFVFYVNAEQRGGGKSNPLKGSI